MFIIDGELRAQLISDDPKSAEIIKPFLRGRDIKRWTVEPQDQWIVFTRHGIEQFPAVLSYLKRFKKRLAPRPDTWDEQRQGAWPGRKAGTYEWFEIQDNVAYWQEFESLKIDMNTIPLHPTICVYPDLVNSSQPKNEQAKGHARKPTCWPRNRLASTSTCWAVADPDRARPTSVHRTVPAATPRSR